MNKPLFAGLCVAIAGILLWTTRSADTATAKAAVKAEKDRKTAPEFALKDSNGQTVHLSDYKGKVVLLDFWATWCGPCKIEIPWFMEFEQQLKDRGFAVLGVAMDEDGWSTVKPFIQDLKVNYRIVLGSEQVGDLYGGIEAMPTTFLIDRQGKIAAVHPGLDQGKEDFRNDIVHLLDAPRASFGAPSRGAFAFFTGAN